MGSCLRNIGSILFRPMQGWHELRRARRDEVALLGTTLLLLGGLLTGANRLIGHWLLGWSMLGAVLDAAIYPLICLFSLLGLGWGLTILAPRAPGAGPQQDALRLALYSSAPLWLSSVLFVVPSPFVQTMAPFLGLLGMGHLFFLGLLRFYGLSVAEAIRLGSLLFAFFTLFFVLIAQFLPLLFLLV